MNGNALQIQIIAPFRAAFEWMKTMLFRPFDLSRWLTIAFAAFLAGSWGGGINLNWNQGDWNYRLQRHGDFSDWTVPAWLIAIIALAVLIAIALGILWAWVSSRGRFIFTDCVVKNRAAIAEPWREFRREGNSFFLFWLVVGFAAVLLTAILILLVVGGTRLFSREEASFVVMIPVLIVIGLVYFVFVLFFALVSHFMVPVMYRRRCSAREAFIDVAQLISRNPGPFIVFVLFGIALMIALAIVATVVMCLTCCIGGLPYISTVLLLPAIVWLMAYKLLFLRQFGDPYDVWATATASAVTETLPQPPGTTMP